MGEEINGRINFSALSVESGYFDMYQKFLDCPDADVKKTLIWLIERIITDIFTNSYHWDSTSSGSQSEDISRKKVVKKCLCWQIG